MTMNDNELRDAVDGKRPTYNDFMSHVNSDKDKGCGSLMAIFMGVVIILNILITNS